MPTKKDDDSNNINNDNLHRKNEANNPVSTINSNTNVNTNELDECPMNSVCHFIYPKGSYISQNEIEVFKFIKIKQKKKFLFFKKKDNELERPYLAFLDEHFIYFLKDIQVSKKNPSMRKVGNKYSLYNLNNADFAKRDNSWVIKLEFMDNNRISNKLFIKEMIFDKENAENFYKKLNLFFKKLNMKMSSTGR